MRSGSNVAKELGISTINVQDGIYQSQISLIHGRTADYVFVLGRYFKNLYLKQKIRPRKTIKILGYPCLQTEVLELLETKVKTVDALCKKLKFEFIYRPHFGDSIRVLQKSLPNIKFAPKNETLHKSFRKGDIFISFSPTSFVEAALHSKICIQQKSSLYSLAISKN